MALLGLMVGAFATTALLRALQARQDPYPRAVMQVMQAHVDRLRANAGAGCDAATLRRDATTLRTVATLVQPAFPALAQDAPFAAYARKLETATAPGIACADAGERIAAIRQACADCHADYGH